jgi:hypothetical protein
LILLVLQIWGFEKVATFSNPHIIFQNNTFALMATASAVIVMTVASIISLVITVPDIRKRTILVTEQLSVGIINMAG